MNGVLRKIVLNDNILHVNLINSISHFNLKHFLNIVVRGTPITKVVITEEQKKNIEHFLNENRPAELINTYLCFIEHKFRLQPVLFPKDKIIYQSAEDAVRQLESEEKLWHETEIKIGFGQASVNEETRKIYICPFTGKVFGDNTHPNPQDAIYDWVSKCPENTERVGGLRVKRFFVSEDPEVIKSYIHKTKDKKEPIKKVVYSSVLSGKLFNSKESVIDDFKRNYIKKTLFSRSAESK